MNDALLETLALLLRGAKVTMQERRVFDVTITYEGAGVFIKRADQFVDDLALKAAVTNRPGLFSGIGGFSAVFDPSVFGKKPLIVTSTDGVGTKLKLAQHLGVHNTIGIDLVAMCVNDIICKGAEPVSFLDYFACGKLDTDVADQIMEGIIKGCVEAGCALAGGETAEMPMMYDESAYDLAGFAMGLTKRKRLLPRLVEVDDVLIGWPSSGVHSNGFSLIHSVMKDHNWGWKSPASDNRTLGDEFMTPTTIYVKPFLRLHQRKLIRAAAHITGGGIDNVLRVIPPTLGVTVRKWKFSPIFRWLRHKTEMTDEQMMRVFNCGVGMVLIVRPKHVDEVLQAVSGSFCIGNVRAGAHIVEMI